MRRKLEPLDGLHIRVTVERPTRPRREFRWPWWTRRSIRVHEHLVPANGALFVELPPWREIGFVADDVELILERIFVESTARRMP